MNLAKPYIDIGIYTNQIDAQLDFWRGEIGLEYQELLKVGSGVHQHRLNLDGSVLKLNNARERLAGNDPSGYRRLYLARNQHTEVTRHVDPDGTEVFLVPPGYQGISQIGVLLSVNSLASYRDFYRNVLEIEELGRGTYRWGESLFFLEETRAKQAPVGDIRGAPGFRYLTVQVFAVDREHTSFIARGGTEGMAPKTLGETARISFIKDPDGNWIEISQRASLTGSLKISQ